MSKGVQARDIKLPTLELTELGSKTVLNIVTSNRVGRVLNVTHTPIGEFPFTLDQLRPVIKQLLRPETTGGTVALEFENLAHWITGLKVDFQDYTVSIGCGKPFYKGWFVGMPVRQFIELLDQQWVESGMINIQEVF